MAEFTFPTASRRRDFRLQSVFPVLWGDSHRAIGYTTNLSLKGFCIRTRQVVSPGLENDFTIRAGDVEMTVRARISWSRQVQSESSLNAWHEMGLELLSTPSTDYLSILSMQPGIGIDNRRAPRFIQTLRLTCWNADLSLELVSFDISEGGIRVISEQRPSSGTRFNVDVHLPGMDDPVSLVGQVVRAIPETEEAEPGGFVILLVDVNEEERLVFLKYLRRLTELASSSPE